MSPPSSGIATTGPATQRTLKSVRSSGTRVETASPPNAFAVERTVDVSGTVAIGLTGKLLAKLSKISVRPAGTAQ